VRNLLLERLSQGMTRRADELLAAARVLDHLADELRQMALGGESSDELSTAASTRTSLSVEVGRRVRITIRDKYYGRSGVVVSGKGRCFWDIRLDPVDGGVAQVIYKKASSFGCVED
jgi:hypothetical protein